MNGEDAMNRDNTADLCSVELKHATAAAKAKASALYMETYDVPLVIGFATCPGLSGAFARYLVHVLKSRTERRLGAHNFVPLDTSRATDAFFWNLHTRGSAGEQDKRTASLFLWVQRWGLFDDEIVLEWSAMTANFCESQRDDTSTINFSVTYVNLHVRFGDTLDRLGQTNYIVEQLHGVMRERIESGDSFAIQDSKVAYWTNMMYEINQEVRMFGRTKEGLAALRKNGKHIKLRLLDTNDKRESHLKLFKERVLPRYNPENMAGVPSRSYFANLGVRKIDSKHDKEVIEQALIKEKKNSVTNVELAAIIEEFQSKVLPADEGFLNIDTDGQFRSLSVAMTKQLALRKTWSASRSCLTEAEAVAWLHANIPSWRGEIIDGASSPSMFEPAVLACKKGDEPMSRYIRDYTREVMALEIRLALPHLHSIFVMRVQEPPGVVSHWGPSPIVTSGELGRSSVWVERDSEQENTYTPWASTWEEGLQQYTGRLTTKAHLKPGVGAAEGSFGKIRIRDPKKVGMRFLRTATWLKSNVAFVYLEVFIARVFAFVGFPSEVQLAVFVRPWSLLLLSARNQQVKIAAQTVLGAGAVSILQSKQNDSGLEDSETELSGDLDLPDWEEYQGVAVDVEESRNPVEHIDMDVSSDESCE
uniref:Uncharacterized protein n=1 Tax=Octactis speculum TaxID=3111310 RepID=A0A7S2MRY6_9STRA